MFRHDYDLLAGMRTASTVAFVVRGHDQRHSRRLDHAGASQLEASQMLPVIPPTFRPSSGRVPRPEARA